MSALETALAEYAHNTTTSGIDYIYRAAARAARTNNKGAVLAAVDAAAAKVARTTTPAARQEARDTVVGLLDTHLAEGGQ